MLTNSEFNQEVIKKISLALGEMNERVIFVGGATIGLYIDDPAAKDVRATKDVYITIEIASPGELESIRQELIKKGFIQSPEDDVVCRFRYDNNGKEHIYIIAITGSRGEQDQSVMSSNLRGGKVRLR